ncbi:MAG: glutathione S-transferase family protein [Geminicoccaceae bacterium]
MITVYAYEPGLGLPSASPFVTKALILLKMAGQPFVIESGGDPSAAPKGKLPYIKDGVEIIADSGLIRRHLESRYGADFDQGLSPIERARSLALIRLAEDHLYWCGMYHHWQLDDHWPAMKAFYFGALPPDQRDMVAGEVRAQLLRDLHGHGLGRYSPDEMLTFARDDLQALADALGDKPYFFGDAATAVDAAVAPQLMTIIGDQFDGPLNQATEAYPTLLAYGTRVLDRYFPKSAP